MGIRPGYLVAAGAAVALAVVVGLALNNSSDNEPTSPAGPAAAHNTGGDRPSGAAADAKDMSANPCALVTASDVGQVLGGSFTVIETDNPQVTGPFSERNCGYTGPNDATVQIQTNIDDSPGGTSWKAGVTVAKSDLDGQYQPVSGVGDEAYYSASATISFHKDKVVVTINILGADTNDTTKPQLKALATKAAARIK
jgi:hypothetical protein